MGCRDIARLQEQYRNIKTHLHHLAMAMEGGHLAGYIEFAAYSESDRYLGDGNVEINQENCHQLYSAMTVLLAGNLGRTITRLSNLGVAPEEMEKWNDELEREWEEEENRCDNCECYPCTCNECPDCLCDPCECDADIELVEEGHNPFLD